MIAIAGEINRITDLRDSFIKDMYGPLNSIRRKDVFNLTMNAFSNIAPIAND